MHQVSRCYISAEYFCQFWWFVVVFTFSI